MEPRLFPLACALTLALLASPSRAASPQFEAAAGRLNKQFQQLDDHIKKADWRHPRTEPTAQDHVKRIVATIQQIEKKHPEEQATVQRMYGGVQRMVAAIQQKLAEAKEQAAAKPVAAAAPASVGDGLSEAEAAALEAYYGRAAAGAGSVAGTLSPDWIAGAAATLEQLDLVAVMARIGADGARVPELFRYYGMEQKDGRFADLPYGGKTKPRITNKNLQRIQDFHLKKIYEAKARLAGKEAMLAAGIELAIARSRSLDEAIEAVRLARAARRTVQGKPAVDAMLDKALANLDSKTAAIAHLVTGSFHKQNFKRIVAFDRRQTPGSEDPAAEVTALTPGRPFYLEGYLSESVKAIGAKRHDSQLGYSVTVYPHLNFQREGDSEVWRLPLYTTVTGDELDKHGVIDIPLLPDPATVSFPTHLAYLPSLAFAAWLADLPVGTHTLRMSLTDGYGTETTKRGAHGAFPVEITPESQRALAEYTAQLKARKLAAVVFPDTFGIQDRKDEIPNASDLSKHGKLLRLSAAQTGQVMKPWPNQTEVQNYVGMGYALLEKDGRYSVVRLGFTRNPAEPTLRWSSLGGLPSDYEMSNGTRTYGPETYNLGYEMAAANLERVGTW